MTTPVEEQANKRKFEAAKTPSVPLLAGLAGTVLLAAAGLLAPGLELWEANILRISGAVTIASALLGTLWIMRQRVVLGASVAVGMILVHVLLLSLPLQGTGLILLLVPVPMAWAFISGIESEVTKRRFIYSAIVTGLAAMLIDIFSSGVGARSEIEESFLPLMIGLMILLIFFNGYYFWLQFEKYSLRTKLIFSFVIVTVFSLGLLGILNERITRAALTDDAQDSLHAAAVQTQDNIISFINNTLATVENEAALPVFQDYLTLPPSERGRSAEERSVQETLEALLGKDPEFISSYALFDTSGLVLADTDSEEIGVDKSDRNYFSTVLESGESFLSNMVISETTNEASIYLSSAVLQSTGVDDTDNQVMGVLRVRYHADILQSLLESGNGLVGTDSFGVLFDEHFIHLAHGTAPETLFTTVAPLEDSIFQALVEENRLPNLPKDEIFLDLFELENALDETKNSSEGVFFFEAVDVATGDRQLQAVAIQFEWFQDWILVFFQPLDIFLAPAESQTRLTVLLSLAIAAVVVLIGFGLAQVLANPIVELTKVAEKVSGGDFSAQAEMSGEDEIGSLAEAFNEMTTQLRVLVMSLEDQVAARTRDLEVQAKNLQISAEIARDATSENELDNMLNRAINLTRSRFNFLYVGMYFIDTQGEYAYLRAATGDEGATFLAKEKRLQVSGADVVSRAIRQGEAQIETVYGGTESSMISEATSQLILPLTVGGEVLGAMDIQSKSPDDFSESQVTLFQTMADQLAIATQKADLREEMEQALKELAMAHGQFTKSEWSSFFQGTKKASGYIFNHQTIETVDEPTDEVKQVWDMNESIILNSDGDKPGLLAVPLKIRGEAIGVLSLGFDEDNSPEDMRDLVEDIANRLALVMENARLLEAAQQRVDRQRLVGEVSDQIRGTLDLESILKTAAEKIRESLDLPEVSLRLVNTTEGNPSDHANGNSNAV